jgi:type II secretory pathway pseudopilin PulG
MGGYHYPKTGSPRFAPWPSRASINYLRRFRFISIKIRGNVDGSKNASHFLLNMQIRSTRDHCPNCLIRSAFTIVEVLVAVAILGMMIISLFVTFSQVFNLTAGSRENLRATQILTEKMEVIRLLTWEQLSTIPTNFTAYYDFKNTNGGVVYNGSIVFSAPNTAASYNADLQLVTVEIEWNSSFGKRKENVQTFVARNGIQRYVFEN